MDVLGRVLVRSRKSGLSQVSQNVLRPRLRPRQLYLPLSKRMNPYRHHGAEFSPAQHTASTIPTQTVPAGMNNLAPQSHQIHDSHNRHQQSLRKAIKIKTAPTENCCERQLVHNTPMQHHEQTDLTAPNMTQTAPKTGAIP